MFSPEFLSTFTRIIIYIYLLTLSVAFFINPMPYEYFFYGVEMTTNILFLIVLNVPLPFSNTLNLSCFSPSKVI